MSEAMSGAMSDTGTIEGGCRCGAVRYRAEGGPLWVSHCHCNECRRSSGAPVSTFVGVETGGFAFVAGSPAAYESSPEVIRTFCRTCGTPLTYEAAVYPGEVHITAGTLDAPGTLAPERHVWVGERLPWLTMTDDLPRHDTLPAGVPKP